MRRYIQNCLWLIVPPLAIAAIESPLPKVYRTDVFWSNIPAWITLGENLTRMIVVVLPAFMPLRIASRTQRIGLTLYLAGLTMYWAAWASQTWLSGAEWMSHPVGFLAPAWTPLVWLTGIALIGDQFYFQLRYRPWMYMAAALLFLLFHNLHAWIVWTRTVAAHL